MCDCSPWWWICFCSKTVENVILKWCPKPSKSVLKLSSLAPTFFKSRPMRHTSQWSLYRFCSFLISLMVIRSGRDRTLRSGEGKGGRVWDVSARKRDWNWCQTLLLQRQLLYPHISHDKGDLREAVPFSEHCPLWIWSVCRQMIHGTQLAPVHTDVLLMVLALCSYRLLRGVITMLRAATQAVRHTIHLL